MSDLQIDSSLPVVAVALETMPEPAVLAVVSLLEKVQVTHAQVA
jgi:hypothetical protein